MHRRHLLFVTALALASCAQPSTSKPTITAVVFFTADSAQLDAAAQASIKQAADAIRADTSAIAHVRGFSAPDAGSAAYNKSLALTRAQGVADALVAAGVPRSRLRMESRGAVAFELMPTESRRVEIVVGS